jgi:hypothetical protein
METTTPPIAAISFMCQFPGPGTIVRRQRKVKDDGGPFKGMVTIQSLAEDAGPPLDRVLRQAGGG